MIYEENPPNIVCLVGITDPGHVRAIRPYAARYAGRYWIMIAATITFKNGAFAIPANLAALFERDLDTGADGARIGNVLYFETDDPSTLSGQLIEAKRLGGEHVDAILLNVPWPPVESLAEFRDLHPGIKLFLKIGPEAFGQVSEKKYTLKSRLAKYRDVIDLVILKGKEQGPYEALNLGALEDLVGFLSEHMSLFFLAVAGKFDVSGKDPIRELLAVYPGLSLILYRKLLNDGGKFCLEHAIRFLDILPELYGRN
ncbi:MAG TPA: hypothetical protein VN420_01175 [Candidatus Fimivivens sp.]|nr:hypothetical protein [Candidatus Fimivivens sp.]